MKVVKKREHISTPTFGELGMGDVFFSPVAENPDEPYIVTDESDLYGSGHAVNLTSGFEEPFEYGDAVVKVEATLTIE